MKQHSEIALPPEIQKLVETDSWEVWTRNYTSPDRLRIVDDHQDWDTKASDMGVNGLQLCEALKLDVATLATGIFRHGNADQNGDVATRYIDLCPIVAEDDEAWSRFAQLVGKTIELVHMGGQPVGVHRGTYRPDGTYTVHLPDSAGHVSGQPF